MDIVMLCPQRIMDIHLCLNNRSVILNITQCGRLAPNDMKYCREHPWQATIFHVESQNKTLAHSIYGV